MTETSILAQRLRQTGSLPALLAASWDAFEFIAQIAPAYDDPDSNARGYAFMLATVAACRGRNALAFAPSLPGDDSGKETEVVALGGETQAAATLASLADLLRQRLTEACSGALGNDDRRACEVAIAAAGETRNLLAEPGGQ